MADRAEAARIGWATRRANPQAKHLRLVRDEQPREAWINPQKLLGRALIALSLGPLTFEGLAEVVGVDEAELADRAEDLRGHVYALRADATWIAFVQWESWERIWPLREALLASNGSEVLSDAAE